MINSSWAGDEIVVKEYVNLGIAAATDRGLIVPNIKDAGRLSLLELAEALNALVGTAKQGRTSPADMSGGTFTITNVGVFGVDTGTPILPPGEAAILAFGAVREQAWVHKGKIKPRLATTLGVSFDHRIIDGELGSKFLRDVGDFLRRPGGDPAGLGLTPRGDFRASCPGLDIDRCQRNRRSTLNPADDSLAGCRQSPYNHWLCPLGRGVMGEEQSAPYTPRSQR